MPYHWFRHNYKTQFCTNNRAIRFKSLAVIINPNLGFPSEVPFPAFFVRVIILPFPLLDERCEFTKAVAASSHCESFDNQIF